MLNYAWDDVKIIISTEIFGQLRGIEAAVTTEEAIVSATLWADPAIRLIWWANLTLYGAVIVASIAINAVNNSPLNLIL